jgi:Xaa-Pro aminopeptidase
MREQGLAGMVVFAYDRYSPALYYATGQKIHFGMYVRAADDRAHLVHDAMERDQAARVGCETSSFAQHRIHELIEREGRHSLAYGVLMADLCASLGIKGRVAFFGDLGIGYAYDLLERALAENRDLSVDRAFPDVLTLARMTKDADEVAMIRRSSQGAVAAMERLRLHLAGLKRDGEHFRNGGSGPVTLGNLRRLLHEEFLTHGLEGGDTIVSQGRDAGVPHNRGNDADLLRAGAPLLVDIFPGEAGGGYYSDISRTFCLGPAPDPLRRLYGDVHDAFRLAMDHLKVGEACRTYQERVCDLFEQRGHVTLRTDSTTQEGYVHGLGHGVGLSVHEAPRLGGPPSNTQPLEPGMVITVEPGLYYPSRGLGVRIEDLVLVRDDGTFENLTPASYELEVRPGA